MALKSIYKELLFEAEEQGLQFDYGTDEEFDIYDNDKEEIGYTEDSKMIYFPIKRHYIEQDGLQYDISSILFHSIKYRIPQKILDEYTDGQYFKKYPVAVSFLMRRHDYMKLLDETCVEGEYNVVSFHHGMHTSFSCGKIMSVNGDTETVTVIAGFKREGEDLECYQ